MIVFSGAAGIVAKFVINPISYNAGARCSKDDWLSPRETMI
jgi:hypothetical protein